MLQKIQLKVDRKLKNNMSINIFEKFGLKLKINKKVSRFGRSKS